MRKSLVALAGIAAVAGSVAALGAPLVASAGGSAATAKITFRNAPEKGWYTVKTTPPSKLRVTLVGYYSCDFSGAVCQGSDVIDTETLPLAATHRVSWGIASFWGQPAANDAGGLYPGHYKVIMTIPGTKVTQSTEYTLAVGAD